MTNVWCVRAEYGRYANQFLNGEYAGIGWIRNQDLSSITDREELRKLYRANDPEDSAGRVGANVGQIHRFLVEMQAEDYIVVPDIDRSKLYYGRIQSVPFYEPAPTDGCPFPHRRRVSWEPHPLNRKELSMPLQYALRAQMTVFAIKHREDFLIAIGAADPAQQPAALRYNAYEVVLEHILALDSQEFETLIGQLLTAIGFDDPEVTPPTGDGGVDVTGDLNVSGLATIKIFVQVKRYSLGARVTANTVKQLRASIPQTGQGAFITTADYQKSAFDIASEPGFPPIGLINGNQLVDLLVEHWSSIDPEFREQLGLKPGLVQA